MYRRSSFRDELLTEQCREIIALEQRLLELDSMLEAVATARRAPTTCECGAPVPWGSHFCANCGRPVGSETVIACKNCGHPLPADASFCASCGRPADPESTDAGEASPMPAPGTDETIIHASVERGSDPWEH
jgi:predicted amidophosphoribosyltransferase